MLSCNGQHRFGVAVKLFYFGENAISHNLIMCNKANLLNQSAFLLGVPGSGKSFSAKELIAFLILNTEAFSSGCSKSLLRRSQRVAVLPVASAS